MTTPRIRLVVAYTKNRCIGKDQDMPWHLPNDLQHFKQVTMGLPIIMGRKTWETLGRPLPGRPNLVVSRQTSYNAPGAHVYASLEEAIAACQDEVDICVIGGEQLFRLALPLAKDLYATEIHAHIEGDTFFPELNASEWQEIRREAQAEENGLTYDFVLYQRR